MKPISILIVDDVPDNFDVIETLLGMGENHYDFSYVASGPEALKALETINPDLILLDVMMPGMDGMEVCQRIKSLPHWKAKPIIMVTALTSRADLARCLEAGADDFISKPINALELRARVNSMLRIKQNYDQVQTLSQVHEATIHTLENTLQVLQRNLVSRLAHELNTPIHGILGTIDLLRFYVHKMKEDEIQETLESANQSALRLATLNQKLLIFLELELAALKPQPCHEYQTNLFDSELISQLEALAASYDRSSDLIIDSTDLDLAISPRYLSILMKELVENALKFSVFGNSVHIYSQKLPDQSMLCIEDLGRGMTPDQIDNIAAFMQFERDLYEDQGMGLGLSLVKKIVNLYGGEISIHSGAQAGTVVKILLPPPVERMEAATPILGTMLQSTSGEMFG